MCAYGKEGVLCVCMCVCVCVCVKGGGKNKKSVTTLIHKMKVVLNVGH